jgi:hypothetical protein
MNEQNQNGTYKVHPASREILPDDPMEMQGIEVPGDPEVMFRLLVEEYASMGWDAEAIMGLARDPFYQAFHLLYASYGEDELRQRIQKVLSRVGVARFTTVEKTPLSGEPSSDGPLAGDLVQIDLPPAE